MEMDKRRLGTRTAAWVGFCLYSELQKQICPGDPPARPAGGNPCALLRAMTLAATSVLLRRLLRWAQVFFLADEGTTGRELWKSDGTAAGTVLVKNIWPLGSSGMTP